MFALPTCVRLAQEAALLRVYGLDTQRIDSARWVHVSLFCALRSGDGRAGHPYLSSAKFRHDCETGETLCCSCNLPSVLRVNLVGRVMVLNGSAFVLSCCCSSIVEYTGTGWEFHTVCGGHCVKKGGGRPKVFPVCLGHSTT